jgi:predicted nucleic acid-binding protein
VTVAPDTGAIYALIDANNIWHGRVVEWWRRNTESVVLPVLVLAEISYPSKRASGPTPKKRSSSLSPKTSSRSRRWSRTMWRVRQR